jgi:phosphoserine phosphatase
MTLVATLISAPAAAALDGAILARVRGVLPAAAAPDWLDPGIAVDIPFGDTDAINHRKLADFLRSGLGTLPIDVVVQPAAGRRKKLLLADMDSTMIGQECIDELADYAGLKARISAITERAMRGEIEFAPALTERVALLKGLPVTVVEEVIGKRITLTPGGRTLVATMRKSGAHTCLVSGGFTLFTRRIAAMIGFDEDRANRLLIGSNRRLTGQVAEPILGREAKLAMLRDLRMRFGLATDETLVVGDGANDLAMIEDAGLGVGYRAKPKVAEAAAAHIEHGDLTALLYAQGYRREEFAGSL